MGKYIGPLCRLCRAEGMKLFLKGKRCLTDKCGVDRRSYPPGNRGKRVAFKKSNYKVQLREKQKVKRFYGVGEKQFRNAFYDAAQRKGITGENLLTTLELRLDNVLYRMNFASSRAHARQLIRHGHIQVNKKKVSIPSYILRVQDEVSFREKAMNNQNIKAMLEDVKGLVEIPEWLIVDHEKYQGKVNSVPTRNDVSIPVEEHQIVELYSK
ncbi:MAG: 30S ribosomal protein S4 [Candidatus Omnitrophota bacterium]